MCVYFECDCGLINYIVNRLPVQFCLFFAHTISCAAVEITIMITRNIAAVVTKNEVKWNILLSLYSVEN